MTRLAKVVFGVLIVAAFGAFFVAQQLKSSPSVIQSFKLAYPVISPNGDGRMDRERVSFRLKRGDTVDVTIVDHRGDPVREIASGLSLRAYHRIRPGLPWDGRTASGRPAPDGIYRVRVTLREQGRNIIVQKAFRVDRTPPVVRVTSIGPSTGRGPEILPTPGDVPARIRLNAPAHDGRVTIVRTWPLPAAQVAALAVPEGAAVVTWDGTGTDGAPLPDGTYLAVAESRDRAGNLATSVPLGPGGLPRTTYGQALPGRGGITIRRLALQAPLVSVPAGTRGTVGVGGRKEPYTWSLARVGGQRLRSARANRALLQLKLPPRPSAVYLFTAHRGTRTASVPVPVDDAADHRILVILPVMTWQGRNPVDDDGDGEPNLLTTGRPVRLARVYGTPTVPGFTEREQPLLAWLDAGHHLFDLTTDVALAVGTGPKLAGHTGVLIAGDAVWLPPELQKRLRAFAAAGGTLVSTGVSSLQRQATLTPRLRLVNPTPPATADLFGSVVAPPAAGTYNLTNASDAIGLFQGTTGTFPGFTSAEITRSTGTAKPLASAVDEQGHVVMVAVRVGRGIVIRYGLPQLASRLSTDDQIRALMERSWELLAR